jgi:tight adherence protein C
MSGDAHAVALRAVVVVGLLVVSRPRRARRRPGRSSAGRVSDVARRREPVTAVVRDRVLVPLGARMRRGATSVVGRPTVDGPAAGDAALGAALVVAVLLSLVLGPVTGVLAGAAVVVTERVGRARARRRRTRAIEEALPEALDLLLLGVDAGLNVRLALERVVDAITGPLAVELRWVVDRTGAGASLAGSLDALDAGPGVAALGSALAACLRDGVPAGPTLDRLAADVRAAWRQRGEEAARRLPVKLLFPLVFCTLPALGLVVVVPVLVRSVPALGP